MQFDLSYDVAVKPTVQPFKTQLLKWIGNKQRFAHEIISYFPDSFNHYYEPFLGSGAVLGTLVPRAGTGSDIYGPLIEIWRTLKDDPETLLEWYSERYRLISLKGKLAAYESVKASFNSSPNGADFVFLTRACYGGVVRFRQVDGYMSTPCGVHDPIQPHSFEKRILEWASRVANTDFECCDFRETMDRAVKGDVVYCDPPYSFSQAIVYGAQSFRLEALLDEIQKCKERGVFVILSIDGTKKSGNLICDHPIPDDLFKREVSVNVGRSMLRRFQMEGETLEEEHVTDKLLLTF